MSGVTSVKERKVKEKRMYSPNNTFGIEFILFCMLGSPLSCLSSCLFLVKLKLPPGNCPFNCCDDCDVKALLEVVRLKCVL